MSVDSTERHCVECSATVHRMQGKWWCLRCEKFVKVQKPKGQR